MVKRNTAPSTIPLYSKGMNAKYVNKNKSMKDRAGTIKGEKTVGEVFGRIFEMLCELLGKIAKKIWDWFIWVWLF